MDTIASFYERLAAESDAAYDRSPFSALSKDYCSRFWRDPQVTAQPGEVEIDSTWTILVPLTAPEVCHLMAQKLCDFLNHSMETPVRLQSYTGDGSTAIGSKAIVLLADGGGEAGYAESFAIDVQSQRVILAGIDDHGLRDGIVKLIDLMGLRRAPLLTLGSTIYRPRLAVRLGAVPWLGDMREAVCFGYNACLIGGNEFYRLSTSDAIPELIQFRQPERLDKLALDVKQAKRFGLKTYRDAKRDV